MSVLFTNAHMDTHKTWYRLESQLIYDEIKKINL